MSPSPSPEPHASVDHEWKSEVVAASLWEERVSVFKLADHCRPEGDRYRLPLRTATTTIAG